MTKADALLHKFRDLNVWRRGAERAPHKPLLILLALGRLQSGSPRLLSFDQIEKPLTRLLEEFGPPRKSIHPELPFFHLQTDGVWEIQEHAQIRKRQGSKNPLRTDLRRLRIGGGFKENDFRVLKDHPEIVRELASEVLTSHFPESLHEAILTEVGLNLSDGRRASQRDPAFRREVISAWGHRCVFCGYSIQLDNTDLGLEAAHIQWCQAGGPDVVNNGLACCSIHHQAFDRGAITLSDDHNILVSSRIHGSEKLQELFLGLHGTKILKPHRREATPKTEFLGWHRAEVFRGAPRD